MFCCDSFGEVVDEQDLLQEEEVDEMLDEELEDPSDISIEERLVY